ncbi:MAG: hypothetical protein KDC66_13205 [Phaeodactylibacter sp.]|nr:hypothetical protein [Phaeodactylibacter sp.]MCB9274646.1 hypothetical protein [Lewinellaceae bacterium]
MLRTHITRWLLLALLPLAACDIINPEEGIPAYLYVPDFTFTTNTVTEGSASEKITDVWLSVDGDFLGAYTLPAFIPLLEVGERDIVLQAGIKDNGINATPDIYPYYQDYRVTRTLTPDMVDTLRPAIRYRSDVNFAFIENFEGNSQIFQDVRRGSLDQIQLTNTDVFEGNGACLITLDTSMSIFEVATNDYFTGLADKSTLVYLEVNYKSDVPVVFGLVGNTLNGSASQEVLVLNPGFTPKDQWNKIYFNLSYIITEIGLDKYQVVFQAYIPIENGQLSRNQAHVWLDNIKLLHF